MTALQSDPSPVLLFETINAYQRTEALKGAIELSLFTAIGEGNETPEAVARRCQASERGIRILCDYLTTMGFLVKEGSRYHLTPDSALFLTESSPAYMGGSIDFLLSPRLTGAFDNIAEAVRKGGTALPGAGFVEAENPVWVTFARAMMPMMRLPAQRLVETVPCAENRPLKILDIAAGHGLFGIAFAQRYPHAEVTAVDWPNVLEVARENALATGLEGCYRTLPGDAFTVNYGEGYDLALLTNFLHHFDPPTCERLLRKVHAALADGGRAVTLEFVPEPDRISPPAAAGFSLMMLGTTPAGDAYTFPEFDAMFRQAGFTRSALHPLPPTVQQAVVSYK
ncbi:MAG: methyltransferase domain-containing protein [Armatimonadetes bacterium]|nr:methyltransferase domain-containing protein [Armatimonadota bacterium]